MSTWHHDMAGMSSHANVKAAEVRSQFPSQSQSLVTSGWITEACYYIGAAQHSMHEHDSGNSEAGRPVYACNAREGHVLFVEHVALRLQPAAGNEGVLEVIQLLHTDSC